MDLDVLTRGQVQVFAGILIRNIGYFKDLVKGNPAERQFDTHHLNAGLALSVHPPGQAKRAEFFFGHLSLPEFPDLSFQLDDLPLYHGVFQFGTETLHDVLFDFNYSKR
ncbi:hypothetical protein D9M68_816280 [compost metagenome]